MSDALQGGHVWHFCTREASTTSLCSAPLCEGVAACVRSGGPAGCGALHERPERVSFCIWPDWCGLQLTWTCSVTSHVVPGNSPFCKNYTSVPERLAMLSTARQGALLLLQGLEEPTPYSAVSSSRVHKYRALILFCVCASTAGSGKTYTMTGMLSDSDQAPPREPVFAHDAWEIR